MPCIFQNSQKKNNKQQSKDKVVHITIIFFIGSLLKNIVLLMNTYNNFTIQLSQCMLISVLKISHSKTT